jgi:hypothetical protein
MFLGIIMKTSKMYLSLILIMALVLTPFLAVLPNASAATYNSVTIQLPFKTYALPQGETKAWTVTFSNNQVMPNMDIMYCVDVTASMNSVRTIVSDTLGDFTEELKNAGATDIHFGVAYFGDSSVPSAIPWFGIPLELGDYDLPTVQDALDNLPRLSGGSDLPEDSLWAYMRVIDETQWREDAQHVIVLVADSPVKARNQNVGGYPVTIEGARVLSLENNIQAAIVTHYTRSQLGNLVAALGVTEYLWSNRNQLLDGLRQAVILPEDSLIEHFCEAKIESITYDSDNTRSTDVMISITSDASFTLDVGETNQFSFTATGSNNPKRYNDDTTVVTIGYYIDGDRVDSVEQRLTYMVEYREPQWMEADKNDGYGLKISSNAHSYDAGAGVIFYWDQKQKDEGVLVISEEFFETYFGLRIVVKSSNEYRQLTVTAPGSYDVTKWTDTAGKEHNINMIWLQFYDVIAY